MSDPSTVQPINRCTAHRRNGDACKNAAVKGASVCRVHGGSAPQVRRAAAVRLLMAADSVAGELVKIALSKTASDATKVQAIFGILDRAGLSPRQQIDVDVEVGGKLTVYDRVVLASTIPVDGPPDPTDWDDPRNYLPGGSYAKDRNVVDAEVVEDSAAVHRARESEMTDPARNASRRSRTLDRQQSALPAPEPSAGEEFNRGKEAFLLARQAEPKRRRRRGVTG